MLLDSIHTKEHIDLEDIQSRYPTVKLTANDYRRIRSKRQHQEFLRDLREMGMTEEEYIDYELAHITLRRTP